MQISKWSVSVFAAALFIPVLAMNLAAAQDTVAQAKAREALRAKMKELQNQQPAPATTQVAQPLGLAAPDASDAETRRQVAARAKAREEAEKAAKAEQQETRKAQEKQKAEREAQAKAEARLKAEQEARSKTQASPNQAVAQKPISAAPQQTASVQPAPTKPTTVQPNPAPAPQPKPNPPAVAKPGSAFQPLPAPPVSLSAAKQQKLADLLRQYRADEITPEQYHTARSKILAEP